MFSIVKNQEQSEILKINISFRRTPKKTVRLTPVLLTGIFVGMILENPLFLKSRSDYLYPHMIA